MNWFEVDKEGLAKLLDRKGGKQFAVFELIQNAWDENTKAVSVLMVHVVGKRQVRITVTDDNPEGFKDISHAFTLFAESTKKADPTKRGRFNLGEKLVLACCVSAEISTTTGTVIFNDDGRSRSYKKTLEGSIFDGYLKMTLPEYEEICQAVTTLIPPEHITTTFNHEALPTRSPVWEFEASLPTEIADEEGILRRSVRKTKVRIYQPVPGEKATIYEMGIPVVEFDPEDGDLYHVEVCQKIPLNMDRDNVQPSYLSQLRTLVLNATYHLLNEEDSKATWVRDAASSKDAAPAAIEQVMTLRYGEKRVAYDPTDEEANKLAVSKGYKVVHGGSMSQGEWSNVRSSGSILPAGKVTPSAKPFSPNGDPLKLVPEDKWTDGMKHVVKFAKDMASNIMGVSISVKIANDVKWPFGGAYGDRQLIINLGRMGHSFFNDFPDNRIAVQGFLIHEFGHEYSGDHLSEEYYEALCTIGAKMVKLALLRPDLFK